MRQEIKRRRRGSRQYIIKKKRKKGINKKLLFCGLEKVEFLFAFSQKKGEREIKKKIKIPRLTRKALVGLSHSLARKRNAPPTDAHVFLAREIALVRLAFTSRRFAFLQSSKKIKKTLSQRDYDSL